MDNAKIQSGKPKRNKVRSETFFITLNGIDPIYDSAEFLAAENAEALARIRGIYLRAGRAILREIWRVQQRIAA